MKRLIEAGVAAALLSACSDEPEVVVVEPPEESEVSYSEIEEESSNWGADGLLDRAEFSSVVGSGATAWDADQDGVLTEEEFSTGWTHAGLMDASAAFESFDADTSGGLSVVEMSDMAQWNHWDADDSGVLEAEEFPHY